MSKNSKTFTTSRGTKIIITCSYPKKNPEGILEAITRCMEHLGLFDGIDELFGFKRKYNDLE